MLVNCIIKNHFFKRLTKNTFENLNKSPQKTWKRKCTQGEASFNIYMYFNYDL